MSLFGSTTTPATTSTPLFGSTTQKPGGLFGSTTTAATTAATSSVPLFGSTTTSTTSVSTGGLFGSKSAASTAAPTVGLFGTTATSIAPSTTTFGAPPATSTTLGLGGVQQQNSGGSTNASGTVTSSLTGNSEKDAAKDSEWQQAATFIRDMLPLIEERLKKNRDMMEETENMTVDNVAIEEMIDKTRGWIGEVRRDISTATGTSEGIAQFVSHDKSLVVTAKRVQEQSATANQSMQASAIKQHLAERIQVYDLEMRALQDRVTFMRNRFEKLLKGEPSLTMEELDQYFIRCDNTVTNADYHVNQLGKDIEDVRDLLIEQGYTQLRKWNTTVNYVDPASAVSEGAEFFPSQSSLAVIGSSLRAPAVAAPAVGGLGLGTGSSLFGNTGGSSLFASTTTKPAFSGGSLFGSTTAPTSSTGTTAPATSLFGSKPTTSTPFASTVANNSSGLLFSSKK